MSCLFSPLWQMDILMYNCYMIWLSAHLGSVSAVDALQVSLSHEQWKTWWSLLLWASNRTIGTLSSSTKVSASGRSLSVSQPNLGSPTLEVERRKSSVSAPPKALRGREPRHTNTSLVALLLEVILRREAGLHGSQWRKFSSWIHIF